MGLLKEQSQFEYRLFNFYYHSSYETAVHLEEFLNEQQLNQNSPLLIEVSFDQYDDVLAYLQENTSIDFAILQKTVRKGAFTYEQVRHIAEACCIHELSVVDGSEIKLESTVLSMSALISYAQSKWNGANRSTALKNAVLTGIAVFGETFTEEVILHHLNTHSAEMTVMDEKQMIDIIAKNGTKSVAKKMATKITKKAMLSSAVAKKTIMMLNANVVTGALVTGVMSTVDIVRAIKGHLSPQQLFKNVAETAASVGGGIVGMIIFAAIGHSIPSISTTFISLIGGIIGLIIGSLLMTKVASRILDRFIKDDSVEMLEIFNDVLAERAEAFLLNEQELKEAIEDFSAHYDMKKEMRLMYAAENHQAYAEKMINHELCRIVRNRMYLHVPSNEEVYEAMQQL